MLVPCLRRGVAVQARGRLLRVPIGGTGAGADPGDVVNVGGRSPGRIVSRTLPGGTLSGL